MKRLKSGGVRFALIAAVALLLIAMAVFFVIGAGESGLNKVFGGNFFAPENLLAWQIPALRGIEVIVQESESEHEPEQEPAQEPAPNPLPSLSPETAGSPAPAETPVSDVKVEVVQIDPTISESVKVEILGMQGEQLPSIDLGGEAPRVLIYQTHATEAYTQTDAFKYTLSGDWRTQDIARNIVTVGELLAHELHDKYGFAVLHDTTDHEPPKLATSYARSLATMLQYKEKYPTLDMFIDVHRDADLSKGDNTDFVTIDGRRVARMMFVVGTGQGVTGEGWKERPNWKENYKLALNITNELNKICPTLAKPIRVKTSRYNQHVSNHAVLVEIGHNKNTLEESLAAVQYLAQAIAAATGKG